MRAFIPEPGFEDELGQQDEMRETKRVQAKAVISKAAALTERGTGATARAYVVEEDEDGNVAAANTDPFFHLTEWGSANNAPQAPLRRGVRAAGLRLEESPKP